MKEYGNQTLEEVVHSMTFKKQSLLYYLFAMSIQRPSWELSSILGCVPMYIRAGVMSKFTVEESEVLIFLMNMAQLEGRAPIQQ